MLFTKALFSSLVGSSLARSTPVEKEPLINARKAQVGCYDGGYLLYSTSYTTVCVGNLGAGIIIGFGIPGAAALGGLAKRAWSSNQAIPTEVSIPAPAPESKRAATGKRAWSSDYAFPIKVSVPAPVPESNEANTIRKRASNVQNYNIEFYAGYDYHDTSNPQTDSQWEAAIQAAIQYMDKQQVECLQAFVDDSETNYENRVTIWVDVGDGVDHRSC